MTDQDTRLEPRLTTAIRERDEARDALASLDDPLAWIAENYPTVMDAMPAAYFRAIEAAGATLAAKVSS